MKARESAEREDVVEFEWFVGVDWGSLHHAVCATDMAGTPLLEQRVEHTSVGLERFVRQLSELTDGQLGRVAVGIETPRGAVVDILVERGAAVFSVNPKQLDRFRDRFSVAGAKDDPLDALVLASAVRTDRARFRRVTLDEPLVIRIRELTRAQEDLADEFLALTNRLRELVHRIAPQWLTLSGNADDVWFWSLLDLAATPRLGRDLPRRKLERLLTSHRIRRVSVDELLTVLATPAPQVVAGTVEAVTRHIRLLVPRIRLVHEQRQACTEELDVVLDELGTVSDTSAEQDTAPRDPPGTPRAPSARREGGTVSGDDARVRPSAHDLARDVAILRSLPGVGVGVASALLAEARPLLAWRDYEGLRAFSGVAPVRRRTGKQKQGTVSMRYACNIRLRNAAYYWAFASTRFDPAARRYYAALRARGHTHGRALRSVADRWLRILIAMLKTQTRYDPSRFLPASEEAVQLATA